MDRMESPKRARIYCAGPMGGTQDFSKMRALSSVLREAGYSTFAPVDDGFPLLEIFHLMDEAGWSPEKKAEDRYYLMVAVFAFDLFNLLEHCQAVVANLSPFECCSVNPDSGTVMELSLAYASGRPVVAYKEEDIRYFPVGSTRQEGWDNPMVIGMLNNFHLGGAGYAASSYPELLQRLEAVLVSKPLLPGTEHLPEHILRPLELGRHLQELMSRHGGRQGPPASRLRQTEEIASFIKRSRERFRVDPWNGHIPGSARTSGASVQSFHPEAYPPRRER
ncbi:nucleoside 2-deoxyribosyltransferase [Stigmatella sp. ncwal1]|uniref:Nucleoside 2-deoxyribosyltransferase n=1 Tax=Stigmatella ashevillensis TaxID=2995309 RepID=A0ABT5DD90_9BACT|nr:nucleoside 2-deoxyribosyltransferase [Stigmatella ashevillena]MDC0710994.1 nucleoside 2-deoxyribosyltransferase [Stigmatella ashevillena]